MASPRRRGPIRAAYAEPDHVPCLPDPSALPAWRVQRLLRGLPGHHHRAATRFPRFTARFVAWRLPGLSASLGGRGAPACVVPYVSDVRDIQARCITLSARAHPTVTQERLQLKAQVGRRGVKPNWTKAGLEMAQLICGGCRTLLMYTRSADTVRCSCCNTVNLVRPVNNIAHVNCGQCRTTLMYPYGAPSVKCAVCNYVTATGVNTVAPTPSARPTSDGSSYSGSSTSAPKSQSQNVTVVVENPMTVDDKGKLVSSVVVGVTAGKE
ncbi:Protein LOL3 [Zea mays]|uniref:Protein LOL3 n=1 Tax=Zea mays TaxID=4577 RepID=A0A317YD70_MAIZE|nr:Protein LOL3 [Zea mays]